MNTRTAKSQESKNQSIADNLSVNQIENNTPLQQENNHPKAIQLQKMQEMANNSPQAKKAAQLQALADKSSANQNIDSSKPIQRKLIYNNKVYKTMAELAAVDITAVVFSALKATTDPEIPEKSVADLVRSDNFYKIEKDQIVKATEEDIKSADTETGLVFVPHKLEQAKERNLAAVVSREEADLQEIKTNWQRIHDALQNVTFSPSGSWKKHMKSEGGEDDKAGVTKEQVKVILNSLRPEQIKKDEFKSDIYIHNYDGERNIAFSISSGSVTVFHVGPGGGNK